MELLQKRSKSIGQQLQALLTQRNNGDITQEEYDEKAKLLATKLIDNSNV